MPNHTSVLDMKFQPFNNSRRWFLVSSLASLVFVVCGLSVVVASGGYFLVVPSRLLIAVASPVVQSTDSRACGLQKFWLMGLAAPQHVESSQIRGQTHVSCVSRQILNQWTTRKAQVVITLLKDKETGTWVD